MSDFNNGNNFNNQNPFGGNGPEPYNWNGSNNKNNGNNNGGKALIIIAVVVTIIAAIAVSALVADRFPDFLKLPEVSSGTDSSQESSSADISAEISNVDDDETSYYVPEFKPSDDADKDNSNQLTAIYASCAPSCCTIDVKYQGDPYSIGSGFVIDAEHGYIATNHHVIEGGTSFSVIFYDGKEYPATVVNSDSVTDLAILKIEAEGLVQVKIGNSDNIQVGEDVIAIGTPYDKHLAGTMTCGIVSGVARNIDITNETGKVIKTMTLIQTDCSINPGNSGGPLIDMSGNVIGITSLKLVDEQYEGIGFAIPISNAVDIFKKLISGEEIGDNGFASASARIGITAYELEYGLQTYRMYPRCEYPEGVLVGEIEYDSSAYIAGLSTCDIITDFNGDKVRTLDELNAALDKYKAGDKVQITVFRFTDRNLTKGEYFTIEFRLDAAK